MISKQTKNEIVETVHQWALEAGVEDTDVIILFDRLATIKGNKSYTDSMAALSAAVVAMDASHQ